MLARRSSPPSQAGYTTAAGPTGQRCDHSLGKSGGVHIGLLGITLTFVDDLGGALGGALGTCRPGHASIQLLSSLEPAAAFATLSHELAHDLLHRRGDPDTPASKNVREAEAEAVAAIVTEAIGLTHLASARDYIRLYDGSAELLKASLGRIQYAATTILSALHEPDTPEETSEAASTPA